MNKTKISQPFVSRISLSRQIPACLFAGWCLLATTGCTQHEVEAGRDVVGNGEKMEVSFRLSVSSENAPRTRSLAFTATGGTEADSLTATDPINLTRATSLTPEEEAKLTNLCVVQYDGNGAQVGKPTYSDELTYTTNEAGDTLMLDLMLDRNDGTNTVYLLANVGNQTTAYIGKTEAEFKALTVAASSVLTTDGMPKDNQCALIGSWTGKLAAAEKKVSLTRAVAKISFSYEVVAGGENFSFTPTALKIGNVPTQMSYTEPQSQLPEISYTTYVATSFAVTPATNPYCWYLPENLAGKAPEEAVVYSEKEKIGTGVSNATYIELTGDVEQSGVSYPGVVFKLYPGKLGTGEEGYNNYNVTRNSHHAIHVKLMGIDFSDKRFTIGKLTPMVLPDTLACGIGETASLQITARPGTTWSFLLPAWLSVCINGKMNVPPLYNVSYFGSSSLQFTTATINPEATPRNFKFKLDTAVITLTQDTAAFWMHPQELMLANTDTEQSITINATEGLSWIITKKAGGSDYINTVVETQSYIGTQTLAFDAIKNEGKARSAVFTIGTVGSLPARELTLTVMQEPRTAALVTINQAELTALEDKQKGQFPPFNYDGGEDLPETVGTDYGKEIVEKGGSYTIEVEAGQNSILSYGPRNNLENNAIKYCAELSEGEEQDWRVPTIIELHAIYNNKSKIEAVEGAQKFKGSAYWFSSIPVKGSKYRGYVQFVNGTISIEFITSTRYVRCVRDY